MTYTEIREVAQALVAALGENRPNSKTWDLIIKEAENLLQPRVTLESGGMKREYIVGSPALETAINVLVKSGEKFTVEPLNGNE